MVSATLALAACGERLVYNPLPIPPERLDCRAIDREDRPALPDEHRIEWSQVETLQQAYDEHQKFVKSVRAREGIIALYIVEIEGELWACASDDLWLTEWQAGASE